MVAKWRLRLIWAVVAAVIATIGASSYLSSLRDTVPVVVAAKEIPARAAITADMLSVVQVNRSDRAQFAKDAFQTTDQVIGRYARRMVEPGEVLRNRPGDFTASQGELVATPGEMPLSDALPPGTRAITLKLDKQAVLDQHVRAGDQVDMVFTSKSDSTGGVYSSLLLQQVTVLDLRRPADDDPEQEYMVTVLVSLEQAVDLALAKRTGTIDLVLNPPDPGDVIARRVISPLQFTGTGAPVSRATNTSLTAKPSGSSTTGP